MIYVGILSAIIFASSSFVDAQNPMSCIIFLFVFISTLFVNHLENDAAMGEYMEIYIFTKKDLSYFLNAGI